MDRMDTGGNGTENPLENIQAQNFGQILLVEEEPLVRKVWERHLKRWGHGYSSVATWGEALAHINRRPPDVLITDLLGPARESAAPIRRIKQTYPNLEIIVVTAHNSIEMAVETMKAGVYEFMMKPINFRHAELVLSNCLKHIGARKENIRLRQQNQDLQMLNEIKAKFIALTNHELRTPVGVVLSVAELLRDEMKRGAAGKAGPGTGGFPGAELQPVIELLSSSAGQLNDIVSQMHDLTEMRTNGVLVNPTKFNLLKLWEDIRSELSLSLSKRGHNLTCNIPEQLSVLADRDKFKKVIRELLLNAIKFTRDKGSIEISAKLVNGEFLEISLADNGVGINKEQQERIFQLFYEAGDIHGHHTSSDGFMGGGMGVGLAIVNEIVEAHQGKVLLQSNPGAGSTFTLRIPQNLPAHEQTVQERAAG